MKLAISRISPIHSSYFYVVYKLLVVTFVSHRCGTHPPVRAPVPCQDTSRAENFLATSTQLTQASVQRLLMILFARGGHLATPEMRAWLSLDHIRLFHVGVIKSIVSPGQAALRETRKNGLRSAQLTGLAEAGHCGRRAGRKRAERKHFTGTCSRRLVLEAQRKPPARSPAAEPKKLQTVTI